ncbi:hypothetical protein K144316041_p10450 (plasmid) [Clostridium tetani]|uniref:Uncharacterized protein n=2 Tax=Clostridium tetani TaxID=1513 RepID=A0A4Q0V5C2_CLOTA|nr:hypothetical protein [Clostridium tetani]RXI41366.1 hypothetical protein DP129_01315 [Clostridium tetani]RXI44283.1 hypothetical protein DP130_13475 [Clostridium tetani]BDR74117.1 hypothetical protein K144316041_p10450 [Clostridium tetani]BDR82473.1 hypothetical protein K234311028_p10320 [Clostridium tetani]BDR90863.1 hypothetical protein N072000002_p10320 [Clostridium tetani]
MEKIIKYLFTCALMIFSLTGLFGCNYLNQDKDTNSNKNIKDEYSIKSEQSKKDLDKIISSRIIEYSKSSGLSGDVFFESHRVYGMKTKENKLYIYLTSFIEGFTFVGDKLKIGSSYCFPVRLILNSDDYKFINYSEPGGGMDFDEKLKELFPEKYYEMAKKYNEDHYKLLTKNRNKLMEWLKSKGKDKDSLIVD